MKIQVPGKVFIAGEYGALNGSPTLSVAVSPEFVFESASLKDQKDSEFRVHPDSPAGRLEGPNAYLGQFHDPYVSTGGLGRSTAEFIVKSTLQHKNSAAVLNLGLLAQQMWHQYRGLHVQQKNPPSGVDLVTQVLGGYCITEWSQGRFETTNWGFENLDWTVLLTGHKVKTHEHLAGLQDLDMKAVDSINRKLVHAFEARNEESFVAYLHEWRRYLLNTGLEVATTTEIVDALLEVPGVLAAKGCGALGSDAIFFLFEKTESSVVNKVLENWNPKQLIRSTQVSESGLKVVYEDQPVRTL